MLCPSAQDKQYKNYKDFQKKAENQNVDYITRDKVVMQKVVQQNVKGGK